MFIERLLELMNERNVSIRQLSSDVGFGVNQIKYWKTHGTLPKADIVEKIAEYFGVSVDYLLGKEETEKAPAEDLSEGERMVLEALRVIPEDQRTAAMMECIAVLMQRRQGS